MIPKRKWFIKVEGEVEGPYSFRELKEHPHITPDTLAKKEGWTTWQPIRSIEELKKLFEDEEKERDEEESSLIPEGPLGEITLDAQQEPPQFLFWLIIALLLVLYLIYMIDGGA